MTVNVILRNVPMFSAVDRPSRTQPVGQGCPVELHGSLIDRPCSRAVRDSVGEWKPMI